MNLYDMQHKAVLCVCCMTNIATVTEHSPNMNEYCDPCTWARCDAPSYFAVPGCQAGVNR